jgi:hypothetical protein
MVGNRWELTIKSDGSAQAEDAWSRVGAVLGRGADGPWPRRQRLLRARRDPLAKWPSRPPASPTRSQRPYAPPYEPSPRAPWGAG